ncbi:LPS O-antigen subunit length determinant protein (WzzB/FepE family) [Bradyrhizobium japonicum]|uniref:Wzz/FepE/Etk N-terminal domain-containing protein n=1 Tax=Bradyrhizobium elkanii TaxID=29448 RepID=UPI00101FDC0B|nr:Wzz/FepE/Etk N-terminal domain-containing protein [Bradyrhizobium elkanii]MCP1732630.1 LPS O-antigen subunit length determinant protein (WzzB/FepE family) [Bradyrhizobium elkanii]MCS3567968.1 LPS O-antigen subunit length determinant protein (WzzB/FepE family) [Bradyrhizobium elkanii]MCS3590549.1 LPS O-antigen subunit length determinant protein (WzzB/FepE family) [Bradyrhizobium elkanii]MCS3619992.1 LPS O-antigen subunit length determinant protein (WzzB/FepE family) [Bradyrhizobium elkanii]M
MHLTTMRTTDWLSLVWKNKYVVLPCAIITLIIGVSLASLLPKTYESNALIRVNTMDAFAPFAVLIPDASFGTSSNMELRAQRTFVNLARDNSAWRTYVLSHRQLFGRIDLNDANKLRDIITKDIVIVPSLNTQDPTDTSIQIRFRYKGETSGPEILNGYVNSTIAATKQTILAEGRSILIAAKTKSELELARLRQSRDLAANQQMLEYRNAFDAAKDAGIEKPLAVSSTASVSVINGQMPLYLNGTTVLDAELKGLSKRIGNDLAIPGYADIMASITDYEGKLKLLDNALADPMRVTQSAYEYPSIFPPMLPIALISFLIGGVLAVLWSYQRSK